VLARIAQELFWLGRDLTRAEHTARILDGAFHADVAGAASVVSCVARARERGGRMRDVISTEMWEALNSFYLLLGRYDLQAALRTGPYSVYQKVKEHCALFWGLVDRTMLRDEGRAFLEAADPQPRSSAPVLRLGRLIADLELQRRAPEAGGGLEQILERVQDELELVDRDIDARYFAIAALAAVHL
jgi:uncharacterized alpha-E superfamily protein